MTDDVVTAPVIEVPVVDAVVTAPVVEPEVQIDLPIDDSHKDIMAAMDKAMETEPAVEPKEEGEPVTPPAEVTPATPTEPVVEVTKRPSDEFGELPANTNVKTKERFETMRTKFDELHTKFSDTEAQLNDQVERSELWANTIKSTGATPEQFGESMQFLKAVNSGTRDGLEYAYNMMSTQLQVLAKTLGKEAPGVDPLDQYPDLKAEYDAGEINRTRALELAEARAARKLSASSNIPVVDDNNEAQKQNTLQSLVNLGNKLRANDPYHAAKAPQLQVITKLVVSTEKDSSKWPALIESAYRELPNPTVMSPVIANNPTPIRPGAGANSGGHMNKVAGTIYEALDAALAR